MRRQEHKELTAQGDETLKGSRQLWLYNPENFSPEQRSEFGALKDLHLKVARTCKSCSGGFDLERFSVRRPLLLSA